MYVGGNLNFKCMKPKDPENLTKIANHDKGTSLKYHWAFLKHSITPFNLHKGINENGIIHDRPLFCSLNSLKRVLQLTSFRFTKYIQSVIYLCYKNFVLQICIGAFNYWHSVQNGISAKIVSFGDLDMRKALHKIIFCDKMYFVRMLICVKHITVSGLVSYL